MLDQRMVVLLLPFHPFRHLVQLLQQRSFRVRKVGDVRDLLPSVQPEQLGPAFLKPENPGLRLKVAIRGSRPYGREHVVEAFDRKRSQLCGGLGQRGVQPLHHHLVRRLGRDAEVVADLLERRARLAQLYGYSCARDRLWIRRGHGPKLPGLP